MSGLRNICFLVFFSFGCFAQIKDKNWLLVDSIVFDSLPQQDKDLLNSTLPLFHKTDNDSVKLTLLDKLIESCVNEKLWPRYNNLMLNLTIGKNDRLHLRYKASALHNIGYESNGKGDAVRALRFFNEALEIQKQIGNKPGIASDLLNIAFTYQNQGDVAKAIENLSEALRINEDIGNKHGIAFCLNNLGVIYNDQRDPQKALEYYKRSVSFNEEIIHMPDGENEVQARRMLATSYVNICNLVPVPGNALKPLPKPELIDYLKKAMQIFSELGDKSGTAGALCSLGIFYQEIDSVQIAVPLLKKSIAIYEEIGEKQWVANSLYALGNCYFEAGKLKDAEAAGKKLMAIAEELKYPETLRYASSLLFRVYKNMGNPSKALPMLELLMLMKDSINNETSRKAAIRQQIRYEYEKKEAEIMASAKAEKEKLQAIAAGEKRNQKIIILSVTIVLLIVVVFSVFLYQRFNLTRKQKQVIERQKHLVDLKNKEITDSINYAKRIQLALITSEKYIERTLTRFKK